MARQSKKQAQKQADQAKLYRCRDCANSYDWHSKALDGHLILCRCKYKQDGGRYCIFLSDLQCEHFIKRNDYGEDKQTRQDTL